MEKDLDYAYLRDESISNVMRVAFIRLVPANTAFPANTYTCEAHVDTDDKGNIIGVTMFMPPETSLAEQSPDQASTGGDAPRDNL